MRVMSSPLQMQTALRFKGADMSVMINQINSTLALTGPFLTNGDGESLETAKKFQVTIGGKPYEAAVYKDGPKNAFSFKLSSKNPEGIVIELQQNGDAWDTMYEVQYQNSAKSTQNNTSMDPQVLNVAKEILAKLVDYQDPETDKRFDL